MRKLTEKQIARLLAARATPEPPGGLADRIKAEIPGSIRLDRRPLQPGRRWLLPPLVDGLQPGWLAAASVLLVLSVGIVAARIPAQPDEVWKWMALSGVAHIDDIVVTAPAPRESDGIAVAMAQPNASKGGRVAVPSRQKIATVSGKAESTDELGLVGKDLSKLPSASQPEQVATAATPPTGALGRRASGQKEALSGTVIAARPADAPETGVAMPQERMAEEVAVRGVASVMSSSAQVTANANRPGPAQAKADGALEEGALIVVVSDEAGRPCEGVTVTLEHFGQGATGMRTARTDAGGTATFRGVSPSMYRVVATGPTIAPAPLVLTVASERTPTRAELRVRALPPR